VHRVLDRRVVGRGDEVVDVGVVGERDEPVSQPLGEEDAAAVDVVEPHSGVLAERRRADPQVDDHVEHSPARAVDVFRLAGRHVREVDAAQGAAARDRVVGLQGSERAAGGLGEPVTAEPLEERATVVAELARRADVGVRDLQRLNLHGATLAAALLWTYTGKEVVRFCIAIGLVR